MERTAGIDWGSQEHAVCVLNADGSVLLQFTVPHTAAGLAELIRRLARCGPPERLRVGIERPSGLLVDTLVGAGHPVVPIHPNVGSTTRNDDHPCAARRPQCTHRQDRSCRRRLDSAASTP